MADTDASVNRNKSFMNKPWLKEASLYFLEYGLFLLLLTLVLWLFDSLVFNIFSLIAGAGTNFLQRAASISTIAATLVLVPALFVLWRRVRGEEKQKPNLRLRKAYRFPLYIFIAVQVVSALAVAYLIMNGLVTSIVNGFDDFGRALLASVFPGFFSLAAHVIAIAALLGVRNKLEKTFIYGLAISMLVASLILMLTLAVNRPEFEEFEQRSPFDTRQDSFWNDNGSRDRFRSNEEFFEY